MGYTLVTNTARKHRRHFFICPRALWPRVVCIELIGHGKCNYIVSSMRLKLEELRLQEQLTGCLEESVFVGRLAELTQLMVHRVDTRLSRLDHVAVGRDLHQSRSTQRAVEAKVHHLQRTTNSCSAG